MRLHRFYIKNDLTVGQEITLDNPEVVHQLKKVFRLEAGDKVVVFNGDGFDYVAELTLLTKEEGVIKVTEQKEGISEAKYKITLALSLIKKDNFELVVQKATELGVATIIPIVSERSEKKNLNMDRLTKIAVEAAEQSGRGKLPTISEIVELDKFLQNTTGPIYAFDPTGTEIKLEKGDATILVGPEGGWSEKELEMFKEKNIAIIKLPGNVLRAETAAVALSTLFLY